MIDDLIGCSFRQKSEPKDGTKYDCWDITKTVFDRYGVNLPEYDFVCSEYGYVESEIANIEQKNVWEKVDKENAPVPCLILFCPIMGLRGHVGVYLGDDKFIHSTSKKGVCIEQLNHPLWKNRIEGFYYFKGGGNNE